MKKSILPITFCFALIFSSCECKKEEAAPSAEIEELTTKLEATEAQLLNVKTELSKCKGEIENLYDSTSVAQ